jgi:DNA polymerase-3 subunit gamma/tau
MAYEVTAARRRPQVFTELVGQEYVVQTLQSELRSGNIAQTFLFSGPRGVGKTSAARILAKALNCEQGPTDAPCGTCGPCTEIARAQSFDVVEIDGASHTGVDDVRELRDQVVFPPSSARSKVYIIDEVHMLSTSAFNALLKTIEEPPPYVTFVFATTEPHKVPATVRSRCQHFAFSLIGHERIAACLRDAAAELGATVAENALHWIARQSAGSLRDAFMILDQVIAGARGEGEASVTLEGLRDSIGLLGSDELNRVALAVAARDVPGTLTAFDRALGRGVAVDHFLAELVEYFRSVLFLKHGLDRDAWLSAPADTFPREVVDALSVEQAEKAVELLLAAQRNLKGALNERCEVELALSRLAELDRLITPVEVLERLRELQAAVGAPAPAAGGPRPPAAPRPQTAAPTSESARAAEVPAAADVATGEDAPLDPTRQAIEVLRQRRPPVASALERARSIESSGDGLRVTFATGQGYAADAVRQDAAEIAAAFGLAGPGTISVQLDTDEDDKDDHAHAAAPGVEMIKSIFRGEIVQDGG